MRAAIVFVGLGCAVACSKKEPEKVRTEPWLNPAYGASAVPSAAGSTAPVASGRYALSAGTISFSLPAKEQTTRGKLGGASGELRLEAGKLDQARAALTFDLTSLSLEGEHTEFTSRVLEWLEIGPQAAPSVRERHRQARFELTAVDELTETRKQGSWQAIALGQLSLHGFRVPVEQRIGFEIDAETIVVRSLRPLVVKLAEHDLKPRNAQGHLVASELPLLGKRIGREARVDFELTFVPAAPAKKERE